MNARPIKATESEEAAEYDRWLREQVEVAAAQLDQGRSIPEDEMRRWFEEKRAELSRKVTRGTL